MSQLYIYIFDRTYIAQEGFGVIGEGKCLKYYYFDAGG
jgi:hypothetical protein